MSFDIIKSLENSIRQRKIRSATASRFRTRKFI